MNTAALEAAGRISARLDRLPATRTIWLRIAVLSLGFFFELYDLLYTGYIAPGLISSGMLQAKPHGAFAHDGMAGFMAALFSGLFIGTLLCGSLADRFGRRALFVWSLYWYTVANVVMAFQHTAWGLDIWRFIAGIGIGVELVTIGAYIAEWVPQHARGRAFACEQAVGFMAVPAAALLAYLLVKRTPFGIDGWRWVVLIGAMAAVFAGWMRRMVPESPRWLAQHGRIAEAEALLDALETRVQREYGKPLPAPAAAPPVDARSRFADLWVAPYRRRTLMMTLFNVFQTFGFYGFANWVPTLLIKQGITVTSSLLYSSLIAVAAPIGPLLGLWLGDRVERKSMIVWMAGAIVLLGLAFAHTSQPLWLIALGIGLTLANNIMSYSFHAYQAELFPTGMRARAVGFVYAWSRFSGIFAGFVIASVLDGFGTPGVFVFIAAAMIVVMLAIGLLGPRTRGLALEEIAH